MECRRRKNKRTLPLSYHTGSESSSLPQRTAEADKRYGGADLAAETVRRDGYRYEDPGRYRIYRCKGEMR